MTAEQGFNARERLARLEAVVALQDRLLQQAARRIELLERQRLAPPEPEPEPEPRFIPLAEASRRSGLSKWTLRRMVQRKTLRGSAPKTGSTRRRWLVDADALASLLLASAPQSARRSPARDRVRS